MPQAITWANIDTYLYSDMVSLGHNEIKTFWQMARQQLLRRLSNVRAMKNSQVKPRCSYSSWHMTKMYTCYRFMSRRRTSPRACLDIRSRLWGVSWNTIPLFNRALLWNSVPVNINQRLWFRGTNVSFILKKFKSLPSKFKFLFWSNLKLIDFTTF